jgi:hypothetical protein
VEEMEIRSYVLNLEWFYSRAEFYFRKFETMIKIHFF